MFVGALYVFNQIADIKNDRENQKIFILSNGNVSKLGASLYAVVLTVLSIVFAWYQSQMMGMIYLLAFIIIGIGYNYPPFRWSNRPFWGLIVHFFVGWFSFMNGWLESGGEMIESFFPSIPVILGVSAIYLLTTLPDLDGDKSTGKITFAVRFGAQRTLNFAFFLMISCVFISNYLQDYFIMIVSIMSAIMILRARIYYNQPGDILDAIRYTILYLLVIMGMKYPIFLLISVLVIVLTRLYYKYRFHKKYPVLKEQI